MKAFLQLIGLLGAFVVLGFLSQFLPSHRPSQEHVARKESKLLPQFHGRWKFDLDRTLDAWKANGVPDATLTAIRKTHEKTARIGGMHCDLDFFENVARGPVLAEYLFFSMHQHGEKVCGKAWHHEDRLDPATCRNVTSDYR
ncbi:MAG: hypothetical protein CMJ78_06440 [Planctomycetaceae bacterium]|nr:hypothetical protein [Planctomycetaceae bacterium]